MTPSGEITGYYDDYDEYPQPQRGFLRSRDGAYTTFDMPACASCGTAALSTMPWSINPAGRS